MIKILREILYRSVYLNSSNLGLEIFGNIRKFNFSQNQTLYEKNANMKNNL